jgi:O-antigen/teichoic acid export membrane protein
MASLFRNTFFVTISQAWQMIMAVVMMPFATRYLGVEGFGRYNTATVIMFYVFLINDFGLNTWVTRELARHKEQTTEILGRAISIKTMLVLPCFLFVLLYTVLTNYDRTSYQAIWIFALYGIVDSFTQLGYAVFRSRERMELETIVAGLAKTLLTGLAVLALVRGWGLLAFSGMFLISTFFSMTLSLYFVRSRFSTLRMDWDWRAAMDMLRKSAYFGLALFIASSYDKLDVLMLSWMKGMDMVGLYSAPNKLLSFTNQIPTIFATAFFPQMARFVSDRDELGRIVTMAVKYLVMLSVPMVTGIFLISDQLTVLVFGGLFTHSAAALRIMAFASGLQFINIFMAGLYGATNHQNKILQIEVVALTFKLLVNLYLIPHYGFLGAAISTVATEGLVCALALGWALWRITPLSEWIFLAKIGLSTICMACGLLMLQGKPLAALILTAVLIYGVLLVITRTISLEQLKTNLAHLR